MRVRSWLKGDSLEWVSGASRGRHVWLLRRVVAVGAVVLGRAGAVVLGSVSTARADTACPGGWATTISGSTIMCSTTFHSTGQEQTFAVPTGVSQFNVTAVGGAGAGFNIEGAGSGGGGGGSSFVIPGATNASVNPDPTGTPSVSVSYALPIQATTITLSSSANPSLIGQEVIFTATVSPAPDAGSVTITDGTTTLCSQVPVLGGQAICSTTYAAVGKHSISASYVGDSNYNGSSESLTLYVDTDLSRYLHNGVYNLSNVNLSGGYFVGDNLSGANLANGKFSNANFSYANLGGANLSDANLSGANFAGANLSGASLADSNVRGATLTNVVWSNTTCPDNSNSDKDGGSCLGHL